MSSRPVPIGPTESNQSRSRPTAHSGALCNGQSDTQANGHVRSPLIDNVQLAK